MAQAFPVPLETLPGPAALASVELRTVSLEVDPEGLLENNLTRRAFAG